MSALADSSSPKGTGHRDAQWSIVGRLIEVRPWNGSRAEFHSTERCPRTVPSFIRRRTARKPERTVGAVTQADD